MLRNENGIKLLPYQLCMELPGSSKFAYCLTEILLLRIYPWEMEMNIHVLCFRVFIAVFYTEIKNWN